MSGSAFAFGIRHDREHLHAVDLDRAGASAAASTRRSRRPAVRLLGARAAGATASAPLRLGAQHVGGVAQQRSCSRSSVTATGPVIASMRRTLAALELSLRS